VAETKRQEEDHQESNELENTIKEVESNLRDESLPEFENNSCFTLLPMSEVLRRIKTSEHEIVRIHIQGHTLFNRHIRDIVNDGQLTDGVMDSYIKFVTKDRDINVLECTLLKKIFESNVGKLARIIKTNFIESDLSVGFYNRNQNHWILILFHPKVRKLTVIDPLSVSNSTLESSSILNIWNQRGSKMFGFDEKWSVDVCNHTMQPDLVSCGVFCLWYAELIITAGEVPEILRPPEIRLFRQRIAETLLWIGGNGDWCQKFCRVCGESTPPKKIRPRTKPKWDNIVYVTL